MRPAGRLRSNHLRWRSRSRFIAVRQASPQYEAVRAWRFPHRFITAGAVAKNRGMFLCCVTTRRRGGSGRRGRTFLRRLALAGLPFASLPFRLGMLSASFSIRTVFLLTLGRLPAATTPSRIRGLDNSVGSAAGPGISACSLCEDTFAAPAVCPWRTPCLGWYAESVPWEVATPRGSPRRISSILLGHSSLAPLSSSFAIRWQSLCRSPRKSEAQ